MEAVLLIRTAKSYCKSITKKLKLFGHYRKIGEVTVCNNFHSFVYQFLSIHFKAHKFASSQTNDINVSILGLYFLDQCFNPGKNSTNLLLGSFSEKISCTIW